MSPHAHTWNAWIRANWPVLLLWNEARGFLHVAQFWLTLTPTFPQ